MKKARTAAAVFVLALFGLAFVENHDSEAETIDVWDGVFTEEQVERGEAAYMANCSMCHGQNLRATDSMAVDLTGFGFNPWYGRTVAERFERIRTTMPAGMPNTLSPQQYIDIVAFIMHYNGLPVGEEELPTDLEVLEQIVIERPPEEEESAE